MRIELSLNQASLVLQVLRAVDAKLKPDEEFEVFDAGAAAGSESA